MFNATNAASTLTIADMQGVVVFSYHYQKEGAFIETINTSLLASGIYNVSFSNGKTTEMQKLTVIH